MIFVLILVTTVFLYLLFCSTKQREKKKETLSVNFHFTRKCNYECGFCFHTDKKGEEIVSFENAKEAIELLKKEGMAKINFAGGEPFLKPKLLGQMIKFSKVKTLKLEISLLVITCFR